MTEAPSFAELDVSKYTNLHIDPLREQYPGPLACTPLNAFFALPHEIKPLFFAGLQKAYDLLPVEIAQTAKQSERKEYDYYVQEKAYGAIADNFAELLDPAYREKRDTLKRIAAGVKKLRGIFYRMTRTADLIHLKQAVETIPTLIPALQTNS